MKKIYLYTKFERFWHWSQALLIIALAATGFEVNGAFSFLGFKDAVDIHNILGICWGGLFAFIIFWELTTGEWKQYIPTFQKLIAVMRYYGLGIFKGESHPVPKSKDKKHNPLQRLVYLSLAIVLIPLQMTTGFLYWTYNSWAGVDGSANLSLLGAVHLAGAFGILMFLIVHTYMITTGHSLWGHLTAMITGWEEADETDRKKAPSVAGLQ